MMNDTPAVTQNYKVKRERNSKGEKREGRGRERKREREREGERERRGERQSGERHIQRRVWGGRRERETERV